MTPALAVHNLRKTYKNGFEALKGVDLEVNPGDFFALLGPNGAGKTTLIGIVSTLVRSSGGSVSIFGHDLDTQPAAAKKLLGLMPQEINFSLFERVEQIVVNQAGFYGIARPLARRRAEHYLRQLGLWDKREQQSRQLSGGMKRRLMIARALVHQPKLLILDEPTAGVDIELRRSMWDFLREINAQGTTIILTTHYLEEAESLCRNIAIIDAGQLVTHTSMKGLLTQLSNETFVLDVTGMPAVLPAIEGHALRRVDDNTLEVEVAKEQGLNRLFRVLSEHGIQVLSMRNKANRLEQLFMHLVTHSQPGVAA